MLKRSALAVCGVGALAGLGGMAYWKLWRPNPMVLIGETGPPKEFRWVYGEEDATISSTSAYEPFSMGSNDIALAEVLAHPPWEQFRLETMLRQDSPEGVIGLFFSLGQHESAGRRFLISCILTYADRGKFAGTLQLSCLALPTTAPYFARTLAKFGTKPFDSQKRLGNAIDWRTITVDLTRKKVVVSCNGEFALDCEVENMARRVSEQNSDLADLNWRMAPQAGLGLYLEQTVPLSPVAASFHQWSIRELW
jgi:hypothetical protein